MVRVSTFGQQTLILNSLMTNQQRVFEAQRQITTGKKTDDFKGLAGDTGTVLGARSFQARTENYQQTIDTVRGKLDANDVQVGGIIAAMEDLKDTMLTSIANDQAEGLMELLEQNFNFVVNALNTNFDGTFLFSGANTGTEPVNIQSIDELAALPGVADAFDNADISFRARIADGVELEFGILADDVASDIFQVMLDIYNFSNGPSGPLDGNLDDTQWNYLRSDVQNLSSAIDGLRQVQTKNGVAFNRLDVIENQHEDALVFLEPFIADLEDVDIAEAVTRLNNNQLALEASYRAVSALQDLSLLRFI